MPKITIVDNSIHPIDRQLLIECDLFLASISRSLQRYENRMTQLKYQMVIQWSDEDHCFLVRFPDFPGQRWRTHGDTYELAVTNGIEALESLIIAYEATGDPLPEPTVIQAA